MTAIPLSGNFTLMCYVKSTTDLVWLINYSGLENYRQGFIKQSLANRTTGYIQLVFVKEGTTLKVYAENQLLDVVSLPDGSPTGFTLMISTWLAVRHRWMISKCLTRLCLSQRSELPLTTRRM